MVVRMPYYKGIILFSFLTERNCAVENIIFPLWARRQTVDISLHRVFIIF